MSARAPGRWRPARFCLPFAFIVTMTTLASPSPSTFLPLETPAVPPAQILLLNLILLTNHANMPSSSTIFLPLNQSIAMAFPSSQSLDTVSYHIAGVRYLYKDLLSLQARPLLLSTLLPGRTIRVSRTGYDLLVDQQEIIAPDLYFDDQVVVHGIRSALDPEFHMSQSSDAAPRVWPFLGSGP